VPLTDKLNEVISYLNERSDTYRRAVAVEELMVIQARTLVGWWKKRGLTKKDIRRLIEL